MGSPETPDERGERLYRKSWVSQQPEWYLQLFRIWWLTSMTAVVLAGWAVEAWREGAPGEWVPPAVLAALMGVAGCVQFRSWRRDRRNRPQAKEWKRPWLE